MSRWYYLKNGQPHGPIDDASITESLKRGHLGPFDLVFREGDAQWAMVTHFPDLIGVLSEEESPKWSDHWVLLVKHPDSKARIQEGPFSTEEVRRRIYAGEVSFSDYIWKEGMKEWYRIAAIEIFDDRSSRRQIKRSATPAPEVSVEPVKDSSAALLSSVVVEEKTHLVSPRNDYPVPEEAEGLDLTLQTDSAIGPEMQAEKPRPTKKLGLKKIVDPRIKAMPKARNEKSEESSIRELLSDGVAALFFRRPSVVHLVFVGGLLACALVVVLISSYKERSAGVLKKPSRNFDQVIKPEKKLSKRSRERSKRRPPKAPTYLNIVAQGLDGSMPKLLLGTDGTKEYPIVVQIVGDSGKVLGHPSYFRQLTLIPSQKNQIMLGPLKMGQGLYQVLAKTGKKLARRTIFIGVNNKKFREKLSRHKKSLTFWQIREKRSLVRDAKVLAEQSFRLIEQARAYQFTTKKWKNFYSAWSRDWQRLKGSAYLNKVNLKSVKSYVYGKTWLDLRKLKTQLGKQAANVHKSLRRKEKADLKELQRINSELVSLYRRAKVASLWR